LAQISAQLVGTIDGVEGFAEVVGRVGGGGGVLVGLDLDGAAAACGPDEFLIDQPV